MVDVSIVCPCCGVMYNVTVPRDGLFAWRHRGELIQKAMPNVSLIDRESLISGFCAECQNKVFGF